MSSYINKKIFESSQILKKVQKNPGSVEDNTL